MKLIVGLGNYGLKYRNTRHNIGFEFLDYISRKYNLSFQKSSFKSLEATCIIEGEKIILVKPLLYMNLSGEVVKKYVDYYNINVNDILIIQDDLDMEIGKIRIHYNRNNGGHNGVKNIEKCILSKEFYRVKIGIKNKKMDILSVYEYVLSKFSSKEKEVILKIYDKLSYIIEDFVLMDKDSLMNKYNQKDFGNE